LKKFRLCLFGNFIRLLKFLLRKGEMVLFESWVCFTFDLVFIIRWARHFFSWFCCHLIFRSWGRFCSFADIWVCWLNTCLFWSIILSLIVFSYLFHKSLNVSRRFGHRNLFYLDLVVFFYVSHKLINVCRGFGHRKLFHLDLVVFFYVGHELINICWRFGNRNLLWSIIQLRVSLEPRDIFRNL